MGILQIYTDTAGQIDVNPRRVKIITTDSLATITTAGYLNPISLEGYVIRNTDVIDMRYGAAGTPQGITSAGTYEVFTPSISNGTITLVAWANPGDVLLPVVDGDFATFNGTSGQIKDAGYLPSDATKTKVVMAGSAVTSGYIAHFVDTAGTIDDTPAAVTNPGDIYAGLSGTSGVFRSYPTTAANGFLALIAINAGGAFNTIISNSTIGQTSTISIPDPGAATAKFILSAIAGSGTQSITTGSLAVTTGNLSAGSSGNAGTLTSFPATAANGSLIISALNAGGAFNTTIRNSAMGQSTVYSLGDIGAATGGIPVATTVFVMKSVAGASAAGGSAAQSFTDTFCTTGSNVIGNWNTQTNAASVLKIVPGNGSFVVTSSADAGAGTFNYIITK